MTRYFVPSNLISADLNGSAVILQTDISEYFGLNEVGARVWAMLRERPQTVSELAVIIADLYEIRYDQCRSDIELLMDKLLREKLVEAQ